MTVVQGSHQHKSRRLWLATAASSLLYALAHPPWGAWPLVFLAVAPVSAVLLDRRQPVAPLRAAAAGLLFGALATYLTVAHWSFLAATSFFPGSMPAAAGFTLAMPLVASGVAFYYAAAFAGIARLSGSGAAVGILGSASMWALAELARSSIGYGNPWASFAAALTAGDAALEGLRIATPFAKLLSVGGPPAIALVAGAAGASIGLFWSERRDAVARGRALAGGVAVAAALFAAAHAGHALAPARATAPPAGPLRVALVQAGVGKSRLWEPGGAAESLARHVEITRSMQTHGADLVVWSENALPFLLEANAARRDELRDLARERNVALLVGGSHSQAAAGGRTDVFNSAFLFLPDGSEPVAYDKRILLPFVEHVPWWAAPLLASPWQGAFARGNGPGVFTVGGWRIAPLLCLEALYPGEVAARVREGADLLVNLSNDSWFDQGAGPEQHFALATLRAAETRRPLVRVATTGVSALVAENGLVAWRLPVGTSSVALLDVVPPKKDSLFVRGGDTGFRLLVLAIATAAILLPALGRGRGGPAQK